MLIQRHRTVVSDILTGDSTKNRGLANAIRADQPDNLAWIQRKRDIAQDFLIGDLFCNLVTVKLILDAPPFRSAMLATSLK